MEPKAKWSEVFVATGEWSAEVGPFTLEIGRNLGRCEIWHHGHRTSIWSRIVSTPCDVADLMRLTEAELARRLVKAAETMEGSELAVASSADITAMFTKPLLRMRAHDVRLVPCAVAPAGWQVAETGKEDAPFELNDQKQLAAEVLVASFNSAQHIELEPGHVALVPAPAPGEAAQAHRATAIQGRRPSHSPTRHAVARHDARRRRDGAATARRRQVDRRVRHLLKCYLLASKPGEG